VSYGVRDALGAGIRAEAASGRAPRFTGPTATDRRSSGGMG